jgi:nicotinamide riboside kinase
MSAFERLIVITGPESTGKTALTLALAERMGLPSMAEYARDWLKDREGYTRSDVYRMALGQWSRLERGLSATSGLLLADTDLLTYKIWLEERFGGGSPWLETLRRSQRPQHYLLCAPDIPWTPDPLRENPHDRERLLDLHLHVLRAEGHSWSLIEGEGNQRLHLAMKSVEAVRGLRSWP